MPDRNGHPQSGPTPVADDATASAPELLARAAQDLAATQAATKAKQQQGGPGTREGVLPAGNGH
jgi:hypothetical protein